MIITHLAMKPPTFSSLFQPPKHPRLGAPNEILVVVVACHRFTIPSGNRYLDHRPLEKNDDNDKNGNSTGNYT